MVTKTSKPLTLLEFLSLPETKPASEYIDGQVIQKPMPQGKHSAIQGEFVPTINHVVKPQRIARAFPELRCIAFAILIRTFYCLQPISGIARAS